MIDLGQIVILGRQPEDRDAVHSSHRRLFRQLDRGQRFEDREQRPTEECNLLPSNRRQCPSAKPFNIGQSLSRAATSAILAIQNFPRLAPARGVGISSLRFVYYPL